MTDIPIYQLDAFADRLFAGNPAAVCPLEDWLDDALLQAIAAENNLAETAFFVPEGDGYRLRWFTPKNEVDLCGHATLASAAVVFGRLRPKSGSVAFSTRSGPLTVTREGELLALDFPAIPAEPSELPPPSLLEGLGQTPTATLLASNYMAVFATPEEVASLAPDMTALARLHPAGVIVTAPGGEAARDRDAAPDFVSRFFAPSHGIPEDSVTGSAHCTLVPYWSARLGRNRLLAHQISERGGTLYCEDRGARVRIAGRVVFYLEGTITV